MKKSMVFLALLAASVSVFADSQENGRTLNGAVNGRTLNGAVNGRTLNGAVNGRTLNGAVNGRTLNGSMTTLAPVDGSLNQVDATNPLIGLAQQPLAK